MGFLFRRGGGGGSKGKEYPTEITEESEDPSPPPHPLSKSGWAVYPFSPGLLDIFGARHTTLTKRVRLIIAGMTDIDMGNNIGLLNPQNFPGLPVL